MLSLAAGQQGTSIVTRVVGLRCGTHCIAWRLVNTLQLVEVCGWRAYHPCTQQQVIVLSCSRAAVGDSLGCRRQECCLGCACWASSSSMGARPADLDEAWQAQRRWST
jgi:hypothetical protein